MKSLFFEHFYDLTRPKYAEKYEDSESGLKIIHFLAKMISFCCLEVLMYGRLDVWTFRRMDV